MLHCLRVVGEEGDGNGCLTHGHTNSFLDVKVEVEVCERCVAARAARWWMSLRRQLVCWCSWGAAAGQCSCGLWCGMAQAGSGGKRGGYDALGPVS
jgi:hypothetical protein